MNKRDYFDDYKKAKLVLNKLICQFYDYSLKKDKANELGINYTEDDILNSYNEISCVFHRYTPEGIYAWYKLGIKEPIILLNDMWKLQRIKEKRLKNIDYYNEYLELKLIDLYLVEKYYERSIPIDDAKKIGIDYYYCFDEYDGLIEGYDHLFESAGEEAWDLFDLKNSFVPRSKIYELEKELTNEKLANDIIKIKIKKI